MMRAIKWFVPAVAILILSCLITVACSSNELKNNDHGNTLDEEPIVGITSFDDAVVDGDKISMFVEHDIESVPLSGKVHVSDDCTWKLFSDKLGRNEIITKVAASDSGELLDGDNRFYILVSSEKTDDIAFYELTLHRSYEVDITYWFHNEVYKTEKVFTGHEHTLLVPELDGYSFEGWETVEKQPAEKETIWGNASYYATASPKHYVVSFDYEDIEPMEVVYDELFSFVVPERNGYEFCGWMIGEDLITDARGNSLSVWKYPKSETASPRWSPIELQITIKTNSSLHGEDFGGGIHHFDEKVTLTAIPDLGYDFVGWYDPSSGELLCDTPNYTFTLNESRELETKWKEKEELSGFVFTSDYRSCRLVRVKDATSETYIIPEFVTDIGDGCFENCTELREITIPKSVTLIGKRAFRGCTNLENVYMEHTTWFVTDRIQTFISYNAILSTTNAVVITSEYVDYYFSAA